jgi:hypothetical protein
MKNLQRNEHTMPAQEPCDPKRLKVLEDAMREAIHAYLTYSDPQSRITHDEMFARLLEILDRREVAEAAKVDPTTMASTSDEQPTAHASDTSTVRRVV